MVSATKPLVICAPEPRSLDLIFSANKLETLHAGYDVIETAADRVAELDEGTLAAARYILDQPPISPETLAQMTGLKAVLNVESNLIDNMPYDAVFRRGIHV